MIASRSILNLAFAFVFAITARAAIPLPASISVATDSRPPAEGDWLLANQVQPTTVTRNGDETEILLSNGLIERRLRIFPNAATVALNNLRSGHRFLRAVRPEAELTLNGQAFRVGGLQGQPDLAYLAAEWIPRLTNDHDAFQVDGIQLGAPAAPLSWKHKRHNAALPWPPPGRTVSLSFHGPTEDTRAVQVVVYHELYDGIPVAAKWLTVSNGTSRTLIIDRCISEELAAAEPDSAVDTRERHQWVTPAIDILSDYMFKGMDPATAGRVASWEPDPAYTTQVSYELQTPCLLLCRPMVGPGTSLKPGETYTSIRTYLIPHDAAERERRGLALRRVWRALAPWITENPIMMHVRSARTDLFRAAVDQCAEVGFEMIIYTFGSGLEMENQDPVYLAKVKSDIDYAHSKGIEVGGYSLFSSRRIDDANDVINPATGKPGGAIFGNAPCLGSKWGLEYLHKITNFLAQTGMDLLEHDGPYPGDICASTVHPGHHGQADSQWEQWKLSVGLYSWCREQGIYINQPDSYFLVGGNKTAMGYRESNWSLPRAQQLIHARQNVFDGTWNKTPSMGWMFVPLTEYQGGGDAATLEPLRDHLHEYELHFANTLGGGVQACWRGPRLYDSDATKQVVKKWVDWFKKHRDILESDLIHAQRANGQDVDSYLHVNPALPEKGLAVLFNPLPEPVHRTVKLPLYYSGLAGSARFRQQDGRAHRVPLDRQGNATITVDLPAQGVTWFTIE